MNAVIHDKRWKQDVLFSERTELITRLEHGCEAFSLLHIFFGRHLAVELLCLMVIASLSHENYSNTTSLTTTATGWHSRIHTRLCGFLQTEERRKGMRCSKICAWSRLEVFHSIVLQWTPFPCSIRALSPQWSSTSFNFPNLFINLSQTIKLLADPSQPHCCCKLWQKKNVKRLSKGRMIVSEDLWQTHIDV